MYIGGWCHYHNGEVVAREEKKNSALFKIVSIDENNRSKEKKIIPKTSKQYAFVLNKEKNCL